MRGEIVLTEEYSKACRLFAKGWPPQAVAGHLGVNRNTALAWAKRAGYMVEAGKETRLVNDILKKARKLSKEARELLLNELQVKAA